MVELAGFNETEGVVTFKAFGCGPYTNPIARRLIPRLTGEAARSRGEEFLVHLGDHFDHRHVRTTQENPGGPFGRENNDQLKTTRVGSAQGVDSGADIRRSFEVAAEVFGGLPREMGFLAVPGDNDWAAFPGALRDKAWRRWLDTFQKRLPSAHRFPGGAGSEKVVYQVGRPENFFFIRKRVAFVGIHRIGIRSALDFLKFDEKRWRKRLAENLRWLTKCLATCGLPLGPRMVVVFTHAAPESRPHGPFNLLRPFLRKHFRRDFLLPMRAAIDASGVPCFFIHADSHHPRLERLKSYQQTWRVCTGQVGKFHGRRRTGVLDPMTFRADSGRGRFEVFLSGYERWHHVGATNYDANHPAFFSAVGA